MFRIAEVGRIPQPQTQVASSYPHHSSFLLHYPGPTPVVLSARAARVSALSRCSPDGCLGLRTIPLLWGPPSAVPRTQPPGRTPSPASQLGVLPAPRSAPRQPSPSHLPSSELQPLLRCSACSSLQPGRECGAREGCFSLDRARAETPTSLSLSHLATDWNRASGPRLFSPSSSSPPSPLFFPFLPSPTPVLLRPSPPNPPTPYVSRDPALHHHHHPRHYRRLSPDSVGRKKEPWTAEFRTQRSVDGTGAQRSPV